MTYNYLVTSYRLLDIVFLTCTEHKRTNHGMDNNVPVVFKLKNGTHFIVVQLILKTFGSRLHPRRW